MTTQSQAEELSNLLQQSQEHIRYFQELGVTAISLEHSQTPTAAVQAEEGLPQIWAELKDCTRCTLHEGRTHVVNTEGNPRARLMFVGEAPGADEDAQARPFVGRAGQLLTKII